MKQLFLILALVLSVNCFASGKISLRPSYHLKSSKMGGQLGLSVWEPILPRLVYNQWTGIGIQPRVGQENVLYFVSQHELGVPVGDLQYDVGFKFQHANQSNEELLSDSSVYVKVTYKLW